MHEKNIVNVQDNEYNKTIVVSQTVSFVPRSRLFFFAMYMWIIRKISCSHKQNDGVIFVQTTVNSTLTRTGSQKLEFYVFIDNQF